MDIAAIMTKHSYDFVGPVSCNSRSHVNLQEPSKTFETSAAVGLTHAVSNGSSKGLQTSQNKY